MYLQQQITLWINIIGGIAVIGSYVFGIITHSGNIANLWGNASKTMQKLYGISMIFAALGYFAFTYLIVFHLVPDTVHIFNTFNFIIFPILYFIILAASSLWMPLSFSWSSSHSGTTWIAIRIVLALVGLGSLFLTISLLGLPHNLGMIYWLAVIGSVYFSFHTLILDTIIWPTFF
jgi:hypothetical protein